MGCAAYGSAKGLCVGEPQNTLRRTSERTSANLGTYVAYFGTYVANLGTCVGDL